MLNYHRERFRKLTFRALALRHFYLSVLMFSFINLLLLLLSLFLIDGRGSKISHLFLLFDKYLLVSAYAYIVNLYLKKGRVTVIVRSLHLHSSRKASSKLNNTSSFVHPRRLSFRESLTCQS